MKSFFSESGETSMVRLCSFMVTLVSCISVLVAVIQPFINNETTLVDKLPIFVVPFLAMGLGAKVTQKRMENQPQEPSNV
jgi:hypothetical protein